jgi:hypothetical protein
MEIDSYSPSLAEISHNSHARIKSDQIRPVSGFLAIFIKAI